MSPERRARSNAYGTAGKMADSATPSKKKPHLPASRTANRPGRINLKAVAEVLAARGLDPTEEIINLLLPPVDGNGQPVPGRDGKPMGSALEPDVRARIWNELLQYTQPKLKSVDVKVKGAIATFNVSPEQARKIAEEYLRSEIETTAEDDD